MDCVLETQDEMMLEFDQSAYYINSRDFYSTVYMTADPLSDNSLSETDVDIISTPTYSNVNSSLRLSSQHQSISERVHTPARLYNSPDQLRNIYFTNDV